MKTFPRLIAKKKWLFNDQENVTLIFIFKDNYELSEMTKFSRFTWQNVSSLQRFLKAKNLPWKCTKA